MKITLRFPTAAYAYAEVEVEGNSGAELEAKLAEVQRAAGLAIQLTGGGDSAAIAERLLREELGAQRINEDGSPWSQPQAPAQQPWNTAPAPAPAPPGFSGPAVESAGPPPFGGPAVPQYGATPNAFGATPPQLRPALVKLPYGAEGSEQANKNKWVKDYAFQQRNKLTWNKERKGFEFSQTPSPDLLAAISGMASQVGGSVEQ